MDLDKEPLAKAAERLASEHPYEWDKIAQMAVETYARAGGRLPALDEDVRETVRGALEADSNEREHVALMRVAEALDIEWMPL